jgi:Ribbon-helix-helix protein, copG family
LRRTTDVKRLQFAVEDNVYHTLEDLKERTDASSLAEVFRDALRAYAWIVAEFEAGRQVVSRPYEMGVIAPPMPVGASLGFQRHVTPEGERHVILPGQPTS